MKLGIAGYSCAGKSSVFDALVTESADATYGGVGIRLGSVEIPDQRLDTLAQIYKPKRVVPARIECVDLPALAQGGFSGSMLGVVQKLDALLLVVRAFEDPSVPHQLGTVDYQRDLKQLVFELLFQDISILDARISRLQKETKGLKVAERALVDTRCETLKAVQQKLEQGVPVRDQKLKSDALGALGDTFLVSRLPILAAVNLDEQAVRQAQQVAKEAEGLDGIAAIALAAKLEAELAQLEPAERDEMREGLEIAEAGFDLVVRKTYATVGLVSFLTVGKDEVRAWPIRHGQTAPQAAGVVHSDIEHGFIRAEVVGYDQFMDAGEMATARRRGYLRREGREYIVADGDIINFLFSR